MLEIQNMSFFRAGAQLFSSVSFKVFDGQRIGLVGRNGCGKSTLFRLILGEINPDIGEIVLQPGKTLAYVEQEIINTKKSALEFVIEGNQELNELEVILQCKNHDSAWFDAQQRYESLDGYSAKARAAQLLNGLGFVADEIFRPVSDFSGGWRMRLNLARALMQRADLLLLDEPTNHLDMEAIIWLENYISNYPGSIILVSHDREFLNATVNGIAHIYNAGMDFYAGNYDQFESARIERLNQKTRAFSAQQEQISHLEDFVRRFRAKATKARQAQSRLKALERLSRIAPVQMDEGYFQLKISAPERSPDPLLNCEQLGFSYDDGRLLDRVNLTLRSGTRIGLLGPNGAGKSTLVKLLAGEILPASGKLEVATGVRIGYFSQHQLENLIGSATPLEHLQVFAAGETTLTLRSFLGSFGLGGDNEDRPVASFSGGEKSRLALALLAWQKPHVLLLDEPTNHLDLEMRDALTLALETYSGAVVLVSHDRSLMRAVTHELWLVSDHSVRYFDGDLDDYARWIESRHALKLPQSQDSLPHVHRSKPRKKALLSRQVKLEADLLLLQRELKAIDEALSDPETYSDTDSQVLISLAERRAGIEADMAEIEEVWLELEMSLDDLV
ncbi:MAG: ABC-F family ATP-binding cassette domain-containing protein [Pseudomonadota bacterium]|nr:ABC-F family ATP-binding cassette domain-containing protein [Pseudomonadota bacterium]